MNTDQAINEHRLRVLHIVGAMNRGGIESWLMNLLRLRRPDVQFDFLVFHEGVYDEEITSLGGVLHRFPYRWPTILRHQGKLRELLSKWKYDVVHNHMPSFAGTTMKIAHECGVPVRIDHAHNSGFSGGGHSINVVRQMHRRWIEKPKLKKHATRLLACSREAGAFFYGDLWNAAAPSEILYYGIPTRPFEEAANTDNRKALCRRYGIPENAIVVGSVGRLAYQKNFEFLIDVFSELAERDCRYVLAIFGTGEKEKELRTKIDSCSLHDRVFLPGTSDRIPEIMCGLFDVFVLPSRFEGFGIVFIEAAMAGLHSVASDIITKDILDILPTLFTPLSLSAPSEDWCQAIEEGIHKRIPPQEGVVALKQTPFTAENSMNNLLHAYGHDRGQS